MSYSGYIKFANGLILQYSNNAQGYSVSRWYSFPYPINFIIETFYTSIQLRSSGNNTFDNGQERTIFMLNKTLSLSDYTFYQYIINEHHLNDVWFCMFAIGN